MSRREDTIFHDMQSERFGGSAYHHLSLSLVEGASTVDTGWETSWIAPRDVRIIANRFTTTVVCGAQTNTLDVAKDVSGGTDRAVITQFDPDATTQTADTIYTPTLSTASADDTGFPALPHVVCPQYGYFVMILGLNAATTGPFNYTYMGQYSFEDL